MTNRNSARGTALLYRLGGVAGAALLAGCAAARPQPAFVEDDWLAKTKAPDTALLYAPHRDADGFFFNPWMERPARPKGSWRSGAGAFDGFDATRYAPVDNDLAYLDDPDESGITFAGHASIIIKMDGQTVLTDPFFSNAALIVRKQVRRPFDFERVGAGTVTLISHNHYDHLDTYTARRLIRRGAAFVVPLGLKRFFTSKGAKDVYELDWWESVRIGPLEYTLLPAQHWSRRIGQKTNATLWGGFLIRGSKTVYFSGDTGYFRGFEEFGKKYRIDYALLGAGAYEPRWFMHYSHMNVSEFFRAAGELNAGVSIPMHFGVISLSREPLVYPAYEVEKTVRENPAYANRVRVLRVGERLSFEGNAD